MRTVWVNGCFDLFHAGHLDLLRKAKEYGDYLIVGVNSDESIEMLKGDTRPIITLSHRLMILESIRYVDQVVVIHGKRCTGELRAIRPKTIVKGKGYDIDTMDQDERAAVEEYGGRFVFMTEVHYPISTGEIINRIRGR